MKWISYILLSSGILCYTSCNISTKVENVPTGDNDALINIKVVREDDGLKVGDKAPDFTLKNVDGQMYNLVSSVSDHKGAIVIFTCNHCPYSVKYEDRIIALDNKYKSLGYPVIAINPNDPEVQKEDSYELMIQRAKEKSFTFPYLFDDGQKVYPQYGASRTPHVYLLQKDSTQNLIVRYIGAIDDNSDDVSAVKEKFVENAVDALLRGEKIEKDFTKAIGCTIKVKK